MPVATTKRKRSSARLHRVEATDQRLTSRAGLALFNRYLEATFLPDEATRLFSCLRKSRKGLPIWSLIAQIVLFFIDGTSRHLSYFDELKSDSGYAATIERTQGEMASSHQVKRFFYAMNLGLLSSARALLQRLFLWRLRRQAPSVIILGLDSMVMDNDQARVRHGVSPTYKQVAGFQPLQLTWGPYVIDAVLRGGKKHCNAGATAQRMILRAVRAIRGRYSDTVPIIVLMDAGFFDQKLLTRLEAHGVGYVCGARQEVDGAALFEELPAMAKGRFLKDEARWRWAEVMHYRPSWKQARRTIYTERITEEGAQGLFPFAASKTLLCTNLGNQPRVDEALKAAGAEALTRAEEVVRLYHGRGRCELVHRHLKDFGHEELPFKRFVPNAAYYSLMLIAFFVFEAFKRDVLAPEIAPGSYAGRIRRRLIDVAGKIISSGRYRILKIHRQAMQALSFERLWQRASHPPGWAGVV